MNTPQPDPHQRQGVAALTLGAIGVVYGDIGTSPLYTMKEVFSARGGLTPDTSHLVGAVSTILWGLMLVVTLKYVILILRADNRGEGGIMALAALAAQGAGTSPRRRRALLLTGVCGAALFYGDSVITPAISVLGAAEGLELVAPAFEAWVVPLSLAVIVGLFFAQRFGTAIVGKAFGPVIVLWFGVLGVSGAVHIAAEPAILAALDPRHAVAFLQQQGWRLFISVGAIVLALTGAEALYADMGHFGRRPIRIAWAGLVLPALALNYMGQGALLMRDPAALQNPFFRLFPQSWLLPAVILATCASVIASQAVISGAYSMTRQAIQLGMLPRMRIVFTSAREPGQIYMPDVNRALFVAVIVAVLGFGSSSALASAYGIAVTLTMLITTVLTFFVVHHCWKFSLPVALAATAVFLALDVVLVAACLLKFLDGGWFPLLAGAAIFMVMATWKRGREMLLQRMRKGEPLLQPFIEQLVAGSLPRTERTAVFVVANPDLVPRALLHNLKHNRVLHQRNVLLTVTFGDDPSVPAAEQLQVTPLVHDFWQVRLRYGFTDAPDIPAALQRAAALGLAIDPGAVSYFVTRNIIVSTAARGMARWREKLFARMSQNAGSVHEFFRLPDNGVVELGARVEI